MSEIKRSYHDNGQLRYEIPFYHNKPHGIVRWWYKDGQLDYECSYYLGQQHGMEKEWRKDGQPKYERYYFYDKVVTEEEFRKHKLIEKLACLK